MKFFLKYTFIFLICIILFTIGVYISKWLIQTFTYTQLDVVNDLYALTKTDHYKNDIIYKLKIDLLIKIFINDINLKDQNLDNIEDVLFFSIICILYNKNNSNFIPRLVVIKILKSAKDIFLLF